MVFFTCNNCGESVKKSSVEKHYNTKCRNNPKNVSCMDCQKDFHGEEYVAHTKCISEAEKYSGKNYVAQEPKNIRLKKQKAWTDIIRSILESTEYQLSGKTRNILERLQKYENVPRKKAKFGNYVVNCLRIPAIEAQPVWEVLEKELKNFNVKRPANAANEAASGESKKAKKAEDKQQNGIKRKLEDNNERDEKVEMKKVKKDPKPDINKENGEALLVEDADKFQWSTLLEKVVAKHSEGLSLDKLKKKLLKKYKNKLNLEELSGKQQNKFDKKFAKTLKKCPAVKVDGDVVKPC